MQSMKVRVMHIVKEDFECNEIFTPDMNMPRVFD